MVGPSPCPILAPIPRSDLRSPVPRLCRSCNGSPAKKLPALPSSFRPPALFQGFPSGLHFLALPSEPSLLSLQLPRVVSRSSCPQQYLQLSSKFFLFLDLPHEVAEHCLSLSCPLRVQRCSPVVAPGCPQRELVALALLLVWLYCPHCGTFRLIESLLKYQREMRQRACAVLRRGL